MAVLVPSRAISKILLTTAMQHLFHPKSEQGI